MFGLGTARGDRRLQRGFEQKAAQTLFSWWCVTAAPLILGTDLTSNIDSYDYSLLHNSEVITVNQAGVQAAPVVDYFNSDPSGTEPETWRAKEADSSFTVLVSNPSGNTQTGTTAWSLFGIPGPVIVRDLRSGQRKPELPSRLEYHHDFVDL